MIYSRITWIIAGALVVCAILLSYGSGTLNIRGIKTHTEWCDNNPCAFDSFSNSINLDRGFPIAFKGEMRQTGGIAGVDIKSEYWARNRFALNTLIWIAVLVTPYLIYVRTRSANNWH